MITTFLTRKAGMVQVTLKIYNTKNITVDGSHQYFWETWNFDKHQEKTNVFRIPFKTSEKRVVSFFCSIFSPHLILMRRKLCFEERFYFFRGCLFAPLFYFFGCEGAPKIFQDFCCVAFSIFYLGFFYFFFSCGMFFFLEKKKNLSESKKPGWMQTHDWAKERRKKCYIFCLILNDKVVSVAPL